MSVGEECFTVSTAISDLSEGVYSSSGAQTDSCTCLGTEAVVGGVTAVINPRRACARVTVLVNPRRACARVTVLVLSLCLSVCVCVCFPYSGTSRNQAYKQQYQRLQRDTGMKYKKGFFFKTLRSEVMASFTHLE